MTDFDNMDDFFEAVFGVRPTKRGKGYEMLVGAVLKLVGVGAEVKIDQFQKGDHSGSTYQIDALIKDGPGTFVEAKDYVERAAKVGRGDLQKLSGALQDLDLGRGMIASATGFTKPSEKYAAASKQAPSMKPIALAHVRPTVEEDDHGRIKTIIIQLTIHEADFENAKWAPKFSSETIEDLKKRPAGEVRIVFGAFYDGEGKLRQTVRDFTLEIQRDSGFVKVLKGERYFTEPTYIPIGDEMVRLEALGYEVPYNDVSVRRMPGLI